ncbi:unnamed protein product [Arabidopsis lyrata]|nr:unnamed protein product [Arabidopsis lyrata]
MTKLAEVQNEADERKSTKQKKWRQSLERIELHCQCCIEVSSMELVS